MTQIVVTLDNNADSNLLRRMIENMKGVLKTSVKTESITNKETEDKRTAWIQALSQLTESVNSSMIDLNDERTKYIMSK
jgi:hypothetical protein